VFSRWLPIGNVLPRINSGDYPDLAIPLHRNANRVIEDLARYSSSLSR
jgi:hypothetical protein